MIRIETLHRIGTRILDARDRAEALGPVGKPRPKVKKKPAEGPRGS